MSLTQKPKAEVLSPHNAMALDTLAGVRGEMARLYRLALNGRIRSDEMTRFIYALKEIRACLEAELLTDVQQRLALLSRAMENHNGHRRLVVTGCGEDLFFLRGNCRIALDERSHYATKGLNSKSEGNNVEKKDVFDISCKDTALDRSADGNRFIRVYPFVGLFAEDIFHFLLNNRHTGHTADEDHFADIAV